MLLWLSCFWAKSRSTGKTKKSWVLQWFSVLFSFDQNKGKVLTGLWGPALSFEAVFSLPQWCPNHVSWSPFFLAPPWALCLCSSYTPVSPCLGPSRLLLALLGVLFPWYPGGLFPHFFHVFYRRCILGEAFSDNLCKIAAFYSSFLLCFSCVPVTSW